MSKKIFSNVDIVGSPTEISAGVLELVSTIEGWSEGDCDVALAAARNYDAFYVFSDVSDARFAARCAARGFGRHVFWHNARSVVPERVRGVVYDAVLGVLVSDLLAGDLVDSLMVGVDAVRFGRLVSGDF